MPPTTHFNLTSPIVKGDIVCRAASVTDVLRFFALNYGTHVFTLLNRAGERWPGVMATSLCALINPFSSFMPAAHEIMWFTRPSADPYITAARSGALCTLVEFRDHKVHLPLRFRGEDISDFDVIRPSMTAVHGRCDVEIRGPVGDEDENGDGFSFIRLPRSVQVFPHTRLSYWNDHLGDSSRLTKDFNNKDLQLSCNYSVLKVVAAIFQIGVSCKELYDSRGKQVERYGYGAYAITVIPYLLMSFINLLSALGRPQYPAIYMALCRDLPQEGAPVVLTEEEQNFEELMRDAVCVVSTDAVLNWNNADDGDRYNYRSGFLSSTQRVASHLFLTMANEIRGERRRNKSTRALAVVVFYTGFLLTDNSTSTAGEVQKGESLRSDLRNIAPSLALWTMASAPYVIVNATTHFRKAGSTKYQRGFIMSWFALAQVSGMFTAIPWSERDAIFKVLFMGLSIVVALPSWIGTVVVVGKMILESGVCIRV